MKFTNINKKFSFHRFHILILTISLSFLYFSSCLKLKLHQTGVEQQDIAMNIYNNASDFIAASNINLQLKQKQEIVNGTNRFVGYWDIYMLKTKTNFTSITFQDHLPNFGRQMDLYHVQVDFRYIMGCNFDVLEESNSFKIKFQMMSKESTTQHVYNIELVLPQKGNSLPEINKYFDSIQKVCFSSQETANMIKGELSALLKENLSIKKKNFKKIKMEKSKKKLKKGVRANSAIGKDDSSSLNSTDINNLNDTFVNGTNPLIPSINPIAFIINPSNPMIKPPKLISGDITDPNVKTKIQKLLETIRTEKQKIIRLKEKKDRLFKRANELLDRMDGGNQELSVILPKNEEYEKHTISANQTIHESKQEISSLNSTIEELKSGLYSFENKKAESEKRVKEMETNYNNIKGELNTALEEENNVRKKISDLEAKSNVETENLSAIEKKKKVLLEKVKDLTAEIKKDGDDIDSSQKTLTLIQTNFHNLESEMKKIQKNIQEINVKLADLRKKENDIKKNIDPKNLSTMETQKETTLMQLSKLEKILIKKKDDVLKFIDPALGEIVDKAFDEITNKDNFDPESYIKVLNTIPSFIWEAPGINKDSQKKKI